MDGFVIRTGGHVVGEELANDLLELPKEDVLDELVSLWIKLVYIAEEYRSIGWGQGHNELRRAFPADTPETLLPGRGKMNGMIQSWVD